MEVWSDLTHSQHRGAGTREAPLLLREYELLKGVPLPTEVAKTIRDRLNKFIRIHPSFEAPGRYDLLPGPYVGIVRIGEFWLDLRPKQGVGLDNLFYMLTYAYKAPRFRDEEVECADTSDLFEFVVRIFGKWVDNILRRGLYRSYVTRREDKRYLRGKLSVTDQVRRTCHRKDILWCRYDEHTHDVLENQILRSACFLLSRRGLLAPDLRNKLKHNSQRLAGAQLRSVTPEDFADVRYTRLNEHYRTPLTLARLLLDNLSPEGQHGDVTFYSFLFRMELVFEKFVAAFLQESLSADLRLDMKAQRRLWLDREHTVRMRPDLVASLDGRDVLILDTKYKVYRRRPSESDIYQMITYCTRLDLRKALLVYPSDEPIAGGRTISNRRIEETSIKLSGPLDAFKLECDRFAERIAGSIAGAVVA